MAKKREDGNSGLSMGTPPSHTGEFWRMIQEPRKGFSPNGYETEGSVKKQSAKIGNIQKTGDPTSKTKYGKTDQKCNKGPAGVVSARTKKVHNPKHGD